MNQDQIKERLLQLDEDVVDFYILFTGKKSKKVDGLYNPESAEILIHNKNFTDDLGKIDNNGLMYTAIHEFAHHVQFTKSGQEKFSRAHNTLFWSIFHGLLNLAEEKEIYENIFYKDQRFIDLAKEIKEKFITGNGKLIREFGLLLLKAYELCIETRTSFEDFADRCIGIHRTAAKKIIKIHDMDINPKLGYENMKAVASIKDDDIRADAQTALLQGDTIDMVKDRIKMPIEPESLDKLLNERKNIAQSIEKLAIKLADVENRIENYQRDFEENQENQDN